MKTTSKFVCITLLACAAIPALAQQYDPTQFIYVRSNIGTPWGQTTNEDAMNDMFPQGWTSMYYETLDPSALLSSNTVFIFLEGGDTSFTGFQSFMQSYGTPQQITQNIWQGNNALPAWVENGGRLLIMSAPNDPLISANVLLPDGIVLLSEAFYQSAATAAYASDNSRNNPFFTTPNQVSYNYTGNYFAHGYFTGQNISSIMRSNLNSIILGQDVIGDGLMVVGGLTTDNFQLPQPDAHLLLENIIYYTLNTSLD